MRSSNKMTNLLVVIVLLVFGTIFGFVLGLADFNSGGFLWIPYFVIASIAYTIGLFFLIKLIQTIRVADKDPLVSDAIRVVAIDDEDDILRLIKIKLTKEGFAVSTASDGEEGARKVIKEKPDVMIVDVMMPKKDGYQVVSEVKRKLGDDAPIMIMLTSKAEESDMVRGLSEGVDDYITKPFSPSELIERINVALIKKGKVSSTPED